MGVTVTSSPVKTLTTMSPLQKARDAKAAKKAAKKAKVSKAKLTAAGVVATATAFDDVLNPQPTVPECLAQGPDTPDPELDLGWVEQAAAEVASHHKVLKTEAEEEEEAEEVDDSEEVALELLPPARQTHDGATYAQGLLTRWHVRFEDDPKTKVPFHSIRDMANGFRARTGKPLNLEAFRAFFRRRGKGVKPKQSSYAPFEDVLSIHAVGKPGNMLAGRMTAEELQGQTLARAAARARKKAEAPRRAQTEEELITQYQAKLQKLREQHTTKLEAMRKTAAVKTELSLFPSVVDGSVPLTHAPLAPVIVDDDDDDSDSSMEE
jgi:hypothetical protein